MDVECQDTIDKHIAARRTLDNYLATRGQPDYKKEIENDLRDKFNTLRVTRKRVCDGNTKTRKLKKEEPVPLPRKQEEPITNIINCKVKLSFCFSNAV